MTIERNKLGTMKPIHSVVIYHIDGSKDRLTPKQYMDIISQPTSPSTVARKKVATERMDDWITNIDTTLKVRQWFDHLLKSEGLNFHPDNDFADYIWFDGTKYYTKKQAKGRDDMMKQCFAVCERDGADIYGIGIEAFDNHEADGYEIPNLTDRATLRIATAYLTWLAGSKFNYHIDDTVWTEADGSLINTISCGVAKRLQSNIEIVSKVYTSIFDDGANAEMWKVYGAIADARTLIEAKFSELTDMTVYGEKLEEFHKSVTTEV